MRTIVSFRDENWEKIVSKPGEGMWLKVKEKFDVRCGVREHKMQAFLIDIMRRLFRAWKARLRSYYSSYSTDEERLSHRLENVELEDWRYLVKFFGSKEIKVVRERNKRNMGKQITKHACGTRSFVEVEESMRNPLFGEKEPLDKVLELQHTRKNVDGELVWLDP